MKTEQEFVEKHSGLNMEKTFERIVENWINGNSGGCRALANRLSSNELCQFNNWLKHRYTLDEVDKSVLFDMVCFMAFV